MPAVSINLNLIPFITHVSSIASLVVPGILLTIAFSSFNNKFRRDDLPELGFPAIATGTPFFIAFPYLKELFNQIIIEIIKYEPFEAGEFKMTHKKIWDSFNFSLFF